MMWFLPCLITLALVVGLWMCKQIIDDNFSGDEVVIERTCAVCGKKITVVLNNKGKILSGGYYFGTFRRGIGTWSISKAVTNEDGSLKCGEDGLILWERCISRWKELKYRLIDLKRLLFHQYKDVEYWECEECYRKRRG